MHAWNRDRILLQTQKRERTPLFDPRRLLYEGLLTTTGPISAQTFNAQPSQSLQRDKCEIFCQWMEQEPVLLKRVAICSSKWPLDDNDSGGRGRQTTKPWIRVCVYGHQRFAAHASQFQNSFYDLRRSRSKRAAGFTIAATPLNIILPRVNHASHAQSTDFNLSRHQTDNNNVRSSRVGIQTLFSIWACSPFPLPLSLSLCLHPSVVYVCVCVGGVVVMCV